MKQKQENILASRLDKIKFQSQQGGKGQHENKGRKSHRNIVKGKDAGI